MDNLTKEAFKPVPKDIAASQQIRRPSLSYVKDAMRRLREHKLAMFFYYILVILILMSLFGPIISSSVNGHTYRTQNLDHQNQSTIMTNARSMMVTKNDIFKFENLSRNPGKTKIVFGGLTQKGIGEFSIKIGDPEKSAIQGDEKVFNLTVSVDDNDSMETIVEKLNAEGESLLKNDPYFRGISFKLRGKKLIIKTIGVKTFNSVYWFGTDEFGRDLFSRLWSGGRVSFLIAFLSVFITIIMGVIYGGVSGYLGGRVDLIMMRIVEILMVVPAMLYIILLLTVMDPGLMPIITVLSLTSWMGTSRIVRGEVLRLKHSEYVMAAETLGASSSRIIAKHLIPNTMGPIIVNMTFMIPRMIFAEAFLSFIGLGVPVPFASWGSLISDGAKIFTQQPTQLFVPAIALSLTMLAFNILGDGLRDALDPKLRK